MAKKHSSNRLISLLIMLLGVVGGYMFASSASEPEESLLVDRSQRTGIALEKFKDITFNFSVLDDAGFSSLKSIGREVINPGVTGRTDIFSP